MDAITCEKLGETVGAEVRGVDRDRLLADDVLPACILQALEANGVLVFPELHIDDATQMAFSKGLNHLDGNDSTEAPHIFRVTLDRNKNPGAAEYLRGTFEWHIDGCTDDVPTKATLLSAHVVAETGGETEFASTYAAYEDLTGKEREEYGRLRVVHSLEASQRLVNPDPTPEEVHQWRQKPSKEHPLIWRHRSGRRSLVLGATASHVVGWEREKGRSLLSDLVVRATVPERVYRHQWAVGDMVIWDNRGVMHRALPYDASSPRDMHRTALIGDEPIEW